MQDQAKSDTNVVMRQEKGRNILCLSTIPHDRFVGFYVFAP